MGILDNLRTQQRWKHRDPSIRIAAVGELGDDQREILLNLAIGDEDAHVRLAAVDRLDDPRVLSELCRDDRDRRVRHRALEILMRIAAEDADPSRGSAAVEGLTEAKHLARIAATASHRLVRRSALGRLEDARALGSVARHATDPDIRSAALERIDDPGELGQVVLKSEHQDARRLALERLADRDILEMIVRKAGDDEITRRATERLESYQPEPPPIDLEAVRAERLRLCHDLEFLLHADNWERVRTGLVDIEAHWNALEPPAEADLERRLDDARHELQARLSRYDNECNERARLQSAVAQAVAARVALCDELDTCEGPAVPERLAEIAAAWQRLEPLDHPDIVKLEARFETTRRRGERRHENWKSGHERRGRREALCLDAERLVEAGEHESPENQWQMIRSEWKALGSDGDPDLQERFTRSMTVHEKSRSRARRERKQTVHQNENRLQSLCERLEERAGSDRLTLKEADLGQRETRAAIDAPGAFPSAQEKEKILKRLKTIRTSFGTRIRELREIGEWKRWANSGVADELCGRLEALVETPDIQRASRQLRDIERLWRQARVMPKEQSAPLKLRFETARAALQVRCDAYFARQAETWAKNLDQKAVLCEKVEALAGSTEWVRTAEEIKKLQAEWRRIGAESRDQTQAIWRRFKSACDGFFTRRKEDLDSRRKGWAENAARKEQLCQQAEALVASSDWNSAAAEIKRIQEEWKSIGPVRRNRSEALWSRFRKACDGFFERYRQRDQLDLTARAADRQALCQEMEALLPADGATATAVPEGLVEKVIAARRRWESGGGLPQERFSDLRERYTGLLERLVRAYPEGFRGTELDFDATVKKMEQLCARVDAALATVESRRHDRASPATILAMQLREALAANTIGGQADVEAKWRAATTEVKEAQSAWNRLGPAPGAAGEQLARRFAGACRRFHALRPAAPAQEPRRAPARRR